ncbi:hypothetical protein QBC47DRAFT_357685 [Echria macrotheca]|uniref:Uncharacterized protein n=1 Tax=Echria macrotheca TaxID=438768 RepID=A0AAJ0BN39_9PEZI|nr:hypothetical protein QBC47DRAFT_357685 [Echria macrotheca]
MSSPPADTKMPSAETNMPSAGALKRLEAENEALKAENKALKFEASALRAEIDAQNKKYEATNKALAEAWSESDRNLQHWIACSRGTHNIMEFGNRIMARMYRAIVDMHNHLLYKDMHIMALNDALDAWEAAEQENADEEPPRARRKHSPRESVADREQIGSRMYYLDSYNHGKF